MYSNPLAQFVLYIMMSVWIFRKRDEAGLSENNTEEFCDSDNHGKVYEDDMIWRIVKIASRVLGMMK